MNERIRGLYEQAHEQMPVIVVDPETCEPTHKIGNGGAPMYCQGLNPEKFALLIIRRCAQAANDWYQNHEQLHWDPATHVLAEFGVEE